MSEARQLELEQEQEEEQQGRILSVRFGRSANCSSVGSIVDVLFVSSVVGTALLGAIAVMLRRPGEDSPPDAPPDDRQSTKAEADEDSTDPS